MPKVRSETPPTAGPAAGFGVGIPPGAPPPRIASARPSEMVSTGLANNFNGRVVSGWFLPRKYKTGKKANTYSLFYELNIQADDDTLGRGGIVTEYYKISGLNQWVPSRTEPVWDGQRWVYTPAGGDLSLYMKLHTGEAGFPVANGQPGETAMLPPDDWRGFFATPGAQNSTDNFPKGTKYEQLLLELEKAGYAAKAPHINWGDTRQFLVGVYGTWVRLPYEFKGGAAPDDAQKTDTLCLAQILDLGPISGSGTMVAGAGGPAEAVPAQVSIPAAVATTPVPAPAAAVASASPLGRNDPRAISDATNEILTALAAQKGAAGLAKQDAGVAVFEGVNNRNLDGATALRFLNDNEWMEADERTFGYDASRGLVLPLG